MAKLRKCLGCVCEGNAPLHEGKEVRFSFTKDTEFIYTEASGLTELQLKGLADRKENWTNIDDINRVFCCKRTDLSDYVQGHWKEDAFFAYQYLNGLNPMLIRRCSSLPHNFPVTDDMVFRHGQGSLRNEMENGNIFLCDYKLLDGVKANTINGKKQYLMAPLILLHKTPDDKLMPIAIQYDYDAWMPNTPISLQLPPPTTKGKTSEATMLQTFPDINATVQGMATMWLLSKQSSDFVPLGQYPEDHFIEKIPCKLIKAFQGELEVLSADIKARNERLEVPYTYMDPKKIENSVAI
ncbi:hypothetical protein EPR50_G00142250 [Perca flavescens]|uniref:Lipoxygenase domain-containing protein n=1 Tax=Perca flavescens TaxID=8167 RepID=A0A484CNQ4_PERFV|nr:arachidonate 15-lipoxygenase B-like [Perca flavescens]TDH05409.1 hypothetical protein EPR50_G00142250 [Perca flavescens]